METICTRCYTTNCRFYITVSCERIGEECSYTGYPFRACIDAGLEAELSIVALGGCLSAGILFLLVQGGQPLHLVQEALPGVGLLRGCQHMRCCACLGTEGALLVLLHAWL